MRTERRQPMMPIAWVPGSTCPCGCGQTGGRLKAWRASKGGACYPGGCVVGCLSRPCIGRRNQKAGKKGERTAHRLLGGTGATPADEGAHTYPITIKPQIKQGAQVPMEFQKFAASEWVRHALAQAEAVIPVGVDAFPAIEMQPPGGVHWVLVKTYDPRAHRASQQPA